MKFYILLSIFLTSATFGQVAQFPYFQNFDSSYIITPSLPAGWVSTQNRTAGVNDFTTTTSTPNSQPNAVVSTNARISQSLNSPIFNFTGILVDSLKFFERRSSTHDSGVLIEASTDGGTTYNLIISDTLIYAGHTNYLQRKIHLPELLNNKPNVRFRWRVIGNGTGTIGTIRFDDVIISAKVKTDIGILSVNFNPIYPIMGDSLILYTTIKNFGLETIKEFSLSLFIDANFDSMAQTSELFQINNFDTLLNQHDSLRIAFFIPSQGTSELQMIVQLEASGDENLQNNKRILRVDFGIHPFSVAVNEIMYRPTAPEPEWVEITNTTNDSINLKLWKISDNRTTSRYTITSTDYYLKPKDFVLITKDSINLYEVRPNVAGKIFIVPAFPALNNDSDAVIIYDQRGKIIDSAFYKSSWGGSNGKSLERIEPTAPTTLKSNWGTCTHPDGATPNRKNSLTQKDFDISVRTILFDPVNPIVANELIVNSVIINKGKQAAGNYSIELYLDANKDSIYHSSELIALSYFSNPINTNDSIIFSESIATPTVGSYTFIARIVFVNDEDTLNNIKLASVFVGHKANTIVINELMYAPISGEPEWFELYNLSDDTVDIRNWKISNRNSSSKYLITSSQILLLPKEYLVVTKDTSLLFDKRREIPSKVIQSLSIPTYLFSNNGDAGALFDNRNVIIDSIIYQPSWGGTNGRSLERVEAVLTPLDSTNWGSSPDSTGATPGKQNYITPLDFDLQALRIFSSKSLPNEPVNIFVVVRNAGKMSASNFNIKLFHDINGDSIWQDSELITAQNFSRTLLFKDSTIVNFLWQNPGGGVKQLIAIVEYPNEMRLRDNIAFGILKIGYPLQSLVINEIMFAPSSGMCEYVELYNRESFPVEMRDWKIHDKPDTAGKANEFKLGASPIIVNPGEFLVLSADSSILNLFSYISDTTYNIHLHIFKKSSLSLNNDGDDVVLKDLTNSIIDSIRYSPKWHNPEVYDVGGRALERINPNLPGNDRRNWTTNANPIGGTPGKQNSVFTSTIPTNASLKFSPNPFSPDADEFEDHCIISYNLLSTAAMVRIRIFDSRGRIIRTLVNNEPSGSSGQVIWDGMNDERQKARIGIYIVLLEAYDVNGGNVNTIKGAVVVAGRL
ncbi:MAG: lamin tail domain-containing protein [Bacteroidota bacterium]|nr:lamin tail domain-containing protein [Bacteroidota bacterium]